MVITDWYMPNMDGLELCGKIREDDSLRFIFVILMTASQDQNAIVEGIDAGADDFIMKPLRPEELQARVKAAERILDLQKGLQEKNKRLEESNKKLEEAYSVIKQDLKAGAEIQASLMPQAASLICGIQFDSLFLPSSFVAGDVFNYFRLDEQYVGFYVLDVSGHGIPAALLSVTLSKALSPANHRECILKQFMPVPEPPFYRIITPSLAVKSLNERFQSDEQVVQYFTMSYGLIDSNTGELVMTQAGHPSPIHIPSGSKASLIGDGGYPVGLFPDAEYQDMTITIEKGDRLFLYSDGITECFNEKKVPFKVERLMQLLENGRDLPLHELMASVKAALRQWRGTDEFEDDVTLLGLERI
jgi:sigma-B regulation protein RsbU (phosphoserine phosphatase)